MPPPKGEKSSDGSSINDFAKPAKSKKLKLATENGEGPSKRKATRSQAGNHHLTPAEMQRQKLKKLMDEFNEGGGDGQAPIVKLGDASMASPFIAKYASVCPTTDIIRQDSHSTAYLRIEEMMRGGGTSLLVGCMAVVQRQLVARGRERREEERRGGSLAGNAVHRSMVFAGG
ncbi:hypothetical protein CQW23_33640 [Capsicum baccatum]|uniref:Uncharacterized protein n=1 Tax=Capsicum baccatum TaxID=33114 RepID=A0A2G2V198_CAPBA|nr:hypothetical protein CQW23_33640 [Capsicum baccatum]